MGTKTGQRDNPDNGKELSGFSLRLRESLGGRRPSEVATAARIPKQTLDGYLKGAMPSADRALALAEELGVSLSWLIGGVGAPKSVTPQLTDAAEADWIMVPRYDLFAFTAQGWPEKPEPLDQVPLRRDWLARVARHTTKLWLCDMPGGSMEDVAREGDELLCRDIDDEEIADGRVYVFMLDGRPLVRRALVTMKGLVLRATDSTLEPMTFEPPLPGGPLEGLVPIGRVIGSIALRPA